MHEKEQPNSKPHEAWAAGDSGAIGSRPVIVSELLCGSVDLRATDRGLDVATGNGNTALAAPRRGCQVVGVDITVPLLEQGRRRAEAENLPGLFREGDAEDLPFKGNIFDIVLSTYGVMFAPIQQPAADELLRVCRPGGKIGLANWAMKGANVIEDEVMARYFSSGARPATEPLDNGRRDPEAVRPCDSRYSSREPYGCLPIFFGRVVR